MSERRAALAYAAFQSKDWKSAAEHIEAAKQEGYQPALQLEIFSAFIAYQRGKYAEAIEALERTLEATNGAIGETALSLLIRLHLLQGDAQRGWQLVLEYCPKNVFGPQLYSLPRWRGEPLNGRRIIVWGTGYGDDILYARFVPKLADAGAEVIINCRSRLVRLFRSLPGVKDVLPLETAVVGGDFHVNLAELPALFEAHRRENIWQGPYLSAEPKSLTATGWRVGLVWGTDSRHQEAADRTTTLAEMSLLATVPGVQLFSLQFGPHAAQLSSVPAGMVIEDLASGDRNFADAAGAIAAMDLVITIDTATANLAGALGAPFWVAVPFIPDWRWGLEGDRTPWYPTAKIYRQPVPADWRIVFQAITEDLAEMIATEKRTSSPL